MSPDQLPPSLDTRSPSTPCLISPEHTDAEKATEAQPHRQQFLLPCLGLAMPHSNSQGCISTPAGPCLQARQLLSSSLEGSVCASPVGCVCRRRAQTLQRPGGGKSQVTQDSAKECLKPQVCVEHSSGTRGFLDQGPLPAKGQVPPSFLFPPEPQCPSPQHCHGEARDPQSPEVTYPGGKGW